MKFKQNNFTIFWIWKHYIEVYSLYNNKLYGVSFVICPSSPQTVKREEIIIKLLKKCKEKLIINSNFKLHRQTVRQSFPRFHLFDDRNHARHFMCTNIIIMKKKKEIIQPTSFSHFIFFAPFFYFFY